MNLQAHPNRPAEHLIPHAAPWGSDALSYGVTPATLANLRVSQAVPGKRQLPLTEHSNRGIDEPL